MAVPAEAFQAIGRLMVSELELAGAGWRICGGDEVRPGVERCGSGGAGQNVVGVP